jgi:hypothetical protein
VSALVPDPEHPDGWLIPNQWIDDQLVPQPVIMRGVHTQCLNIYCIVHHPSQHHMRSWPLVWVNDEAVFRRVCPHGLLHQDPDGWDTEPEDCPDGCCEPLYS